MLKVDWYDTVDACEDGDAQCTPGFQKVRGVGLLDVSLEDALPIESNCYTPYM